MLDLKVVKIHRFKEGNRIKAFVDLGINDAIVIKGLKIVKGDKGLFVSMPQEQGKDERWFDKVRCVNIQVKELITQKVLEAYKRQA